MLAQSVGGKQNRPWLGKPWQRALFFTILAVIATVAVIGFLMYNAARSLPFFDSQSKQYIQINVSDVILDHQAVLNQTVASFFDIDAEQVQLVMNSLFAAQPSTVIVRSSAVGPLFIARSVQNSESLHALAADDQRRWDVHELLPAPSNDFIITQRGQAWMASSLFSGGWSRIRLWWLARSLHPDFLAFSRLSGVSLYGVGQARPDHWHMQISASARSGAFILPKTQDRLADLVAASTNIPLTNVPTSVQQLIPLPVSQDPYHGWLRYPLQATIQQGTWEQFGKNPYADGLAWSLTFKISAEQANKMLDDMLADFSHRYPLALPRQLPDKSEVFELHRDAQAFLGQQAVLDVTQQSEGQFTFPHDQVHYSYQNGVLTLRKGEEQSASLTTPACISNDPIFAFSASGSAFNAKLWKSLDFALSKGNISVCLWW